MQETPSITSPVDLALGEWAALERALMSLGEQGGELLLRMDGLIDSDAENAAQLSRRMADTLLSFVRAMNGDDGARATLMKIIQEHGLVAKLKQETQAK